MNRKRARNRTEFDCQKCGAHTDLSPEHYRRCVRDGKPLMCAVCADEQRKVSLAKTKQAMPRAVYQCEECGVPRELTVAHAEHHLGLGKRILCKACLTRLHQQSMATAAQFGASGQWAHRRKETISINGCTLVAARSGRCKKFLQCGHDSECLSAVVEKGWMGWKTLA